MMSISIFDKYKFHMLSVYAPRNAICDSTTRLAPSIFHDLCNVKCHTVTDHRVVEPIGKKYPSLMFRHTKNRLLLRQLNCKWFFRIFLSGITTQTNTTICLTIHSTIRIIYGNLVILYPICFLAANHEINKLIVRCFTT